MKILNCGIAPAPRSYIGFAGWNPLAQYLNWNGVNVHGFYDTSLGIPHTSGNGVYITSWDQYCRNAYLTRTGNNISVNINDDWVRIDSAWGADKNPDYNKPNVKMNKRFMIWDEVYGNHSMMRKYPALVQYAVSSLQGAYDYEQKD